MFGEQTFAPLRTGLMRIRSCKYALSVPYRLLFILQSPPSDAEPLCAVAATVSALSTELLSPKIINACLYNLWSRPVVLPRCRVVVSFPHQSKAAARCVRPLFLISPVWRQGVSDLFLSPVQCGGKVCQTSFSHQSSVAARCVRPLSLTSPVWRQGVSDLFLSPVQCGGKVCQTSFSHQSSVAARCVRPLSLTSPVWRQGVSDLFFSSVQCGGKMCQTFTPVSWSLFLTSPVWRQGVSDLFFPSVQCGGKVCQTFTQCRGLFSSPVQCGGKVCQTFTPVSWSLFLTSPVWRQGVSDLFSTPVQCGVKVCQTFTQCRLLPSVVVSFPHQSSVAARCVRTTGNWT